MECPDAAEVGTLELLAGYQLKKSAERSTMKKPAMEHTCGMSQKCPDYLPIENPSHQIASVQSSGK